MWDVGRSLLVALDGNAAIQKHRNTGTQQHSNTPTGLDCQTISPHIESHIGC
ncbi:unnamed protein product [Pylaiella littoralis]